MDGDYSFRSELEESAIPEGLVESEEVLELFRKKSVVQVKDHLLNVNHELSEVSEEFGKELKVHYNDILNMTQKISVLYGELTTIESRFRDLCFKDDLFQLRKLPNLEPPLKVSQENRPAASDNAITDSVNITLKISNWTLSVSNFISRFTNTTTTAAHLFDNMMKEMTELSQLLKTNNDLIKYREIIDKRSKILQKYIVEVLTSHTIQLKLEQSVELFNLFQSTNNVYNWDETLTDEFNNLLYDSILQNYNIETLCKNKNVKSGIKNDDVLLFLQSNTFKQNVILRLIKTIETTFDHLEEIQKGIITGTPEENDQEQENNNDSNVYSDEEEDEYMMENDITKIIADAKMKSMGLTSSQSVEAHEQIDLIISKLKNLQDIECDNTKIIQLRDRLVDYLKQYISEYSAPSTSSTNMNEMIQSLMVEYHKTNLQKLIHKQIETLQALI